MFAECRLVMLGVNAVLFFTGLLERADPRRVLACGMVLGIAGLLMLARHGSEMWLYVGVSFTAAGTGLVLLTLAYLAAGTSARRLGIAMGGLAAAAGLGQTLGSAATGWLFGAVMQSTFAWLSIPLAATLALLLIPRHWWPANPVLVSAPPSRTFLTSTETEP